jgi:hypothetical protein
MFIQPRSAKSRISHLGKLLDERPHLLRSQRAVDAHAQWVRMLHGEPERLQRLRVQRAARVENRHRNLHRQPPLDLVERLLDGKDRRLRVERIKDRFHQQRVGPAFDQPQRLLLVGRDELLVRHPARARIVRVARDRSRPRCRAHRAGDETLSPRIRRHEVIAHLPRQPRARDVQLIHRKLEVVVALRNHLPAERVRLDDVRARLQKAPVHARDHVGPRDAQHVAVALQVLVMVGEPLPAKIGLAQLERLQRRPHRAVDDDNAFLEKLLERMHGAGYREKGKRKRT